MVLAIVAVILLVPGDWPVAKPPEAPEVMVAAVFDEFQVAVVVMFAVEPLW